MITYGERFQSRESDAAVGVGHGLVAAVVEVLLAGTPHAQSEKRAFLLTGIVL